MARKIMLIGASGLVGRLSVERLIRNGHDVRTLARRSTGTGGNEIVAPPADWPALTRSLSGEVAICAIGTTMRAAGSQAAF
jgi:uncharacterized protein YbjT (DUF2867 family)